MSISDVSSMKFGRSNDVFILPFICWNHSLRNSIILLFELEYQVIERLIMSPKYSTKQYINQIINVLIGIFVYFK